MGSSNGVTRGQLRPYFSGRTPPFILVGTLIILIIFGFSYWSLNSQYNDLQLELHEFQDQLRSAAQKRLDNEKKYQSLQDQLISAQDSSAKCKTALEKKEEDMVEVSQQLRDDVTKAASQVEEIRINLDKCLEERSKKDGECSKQQDHNKQLGAENAELKKGQEVLKEKINALENELKQMKTQQPEPADIKNQLPNSVSNQVSVKPKETKVEENNTHADSKKVEPTAVNLEVANPDVGLPPGSDGGNDIQEAKNNLQKEVPEHEPAEVAMVNNDAKNLNGVQSRLRDELKNEDIPQPPPI